MSVMGSMESMYRTKCLPSFVPRVRYILSPWFCCLLWKVMICTISHMKHDVIGNAEVYNQFSIYFRAYN